MSNEFNNDLQAMLGCVHAMVKAHPPIPREDRSKGHREHRAYSGVGRLSTGH